MAVYSNGTALINNGALDSGVSTGSLTLISTATASSSAAVNITSGITSSYDTYIIEFTNVHPSGNSVEMDFNMSTDGGSNFNVAKTTTAGYSYNDEAGTSTEYGHNTSKTKSNETGNQFLLGALGNDNDQSASGYLILYEPSSTTMVKHFVTRISYSHRADYTQEYWIAGYGNTTSAVNAVGFAMSSGNIDSGTFKLYGVGN